MEFQDAGSAYGGDGDIEQMLQDLALGDDVNKQQGAKKDSTFFIIDCSPEILKPIEGEQISEFDKVVESYSNFMMSKIIANTNDQVGLILYNIKGKDNGLNFDNIIVIHKLQIPSAKTIKLAKSIKKQYIQKLGLEPQSVPLHHILWLYGQQIKDLENSKFHLRLFLFTADDCPHPQGDQRRDQAINHARQLIARNVHIQLFPVRKQRKSVFDIKKFYQEVVSFDPQELNDAVLDSSDKILDLQSRLRQKQFKKRTLNRLIMKVGNQTQVGIKIFSLYNKAKKPLGKKVEATSNKPLKRVLKKINDKGETLFDEQIGTYYPLGGQKLRISKLQMNKIKSIQNPGITLIGFKPKSLIKPYHNIRTSYFVYSDDEHVTGSSQFFDALIQQLYSNNKVAIVKIMPRANQQLRFAALYPQNQSYDPEDHYQTPPGFNMIILPYADDLVNFTGTKTIVEPQKCSSQLIQVTKLLINSLTVRNFDFRDFENPSLQKFYAHLQGHALNEEEVNEHRDLMMPDKEGFTRIKDVIEMVRDTAKEQIGMKRQQGCSDDQDGNKRGKGKSKPKKQAKKQTKKQIKKQIKKQQPTKKSKVADKKKKTSIKQEIDIQKVQSQSEYQQIQSEKDIEMISKVETAIFQGQANQMKVIQLREYLRAKNLDDKGKKQQLIDRIMVYISHRNQI